MIIRTLGYEPTHYGEQEKTWLLSRLIPIVHNRINMMELAPPGSGKSYVYNNVSRHVCLTTGEISPAVLFYNRQSKMPGVLTRYDLLVLDEAQSIRFSRADEIQAQLKGYLEQGVYTRGDCCATAECGLMLLANIDLQQQPHRRYHSGKPMFSPARPDYHSQAAGYLPGVAVGRSLPRHHSRLGDPAVRNASSRPSAWD